MKYLILGAGGTGGCIGGYLARHGEDVTFIARGAHLKALQEKGLVIHTLNEGDIQLPKVKAFDDADDFGKFDVVFVCVKGYSLSESVSTIRKASHEHTVIVPILNSLSTGERLRKVLPDITILDGCIYVSAYISAPGVITQGIKIFRVVFGPREDKPFDSAILQKIRDDLVHAEIDCVVSDDIRRDVFRKFAFTSAFAAVGAYFDVAAGEIQKEGKYRNTFIALLNELETIADATNIQLNTDLIAENLEILSGLTPNTTTSMQKDLAAGKTSETDELIYDVVRIADNCGIELSNYRKIATYFGYK